MVELPVAKPVGRTTSGRRAFRHLPAGLRVRVLRWHPGGPTDARREMNEAYAGGNLENTPDCVRCAGDAASLPPSPSQRQRSPLYCCASRRRTQRRMTSLDMACNCSGSTRTARLSNIARARLNPAHRRSPEFFAAQEAGRISALPARRIRRMSRDGPSDIPAPGRSCAKIFCSFGAHESR